MSNGLTDTEKQVEQSRAQPAQGDGSTISSDGHSTSTQRTRPATAGMASAAHWNLNWRRWLVAVVAILGLLAAGFWLAPLVRTALSTISTDDAYVNGHVTFVAPRVAGQVARVLVDDNYRVRKGDLLVELDKEPYQVQVAIKTAAVQAAEADLVAAEAQAHALAGQAR